MLRAKALHTMWGPVVIDPVSYAVLPGKEGVVILVSPTIAALGIDVNDCLGECARKRNLSVQGVKSPKFKNCRWMSTMVEALLQRGPGAPEPLDEAVERLVSRGRDMSMEPEQEERERGGKWFDGSARERFSARPSWWGRLPVSSRWRRRLNQRQRCSTHEGVYTQRTRLRG